MLLALVRATEKMLTKQKMPPCFLVTAFLLAAGFSLVGCQSGKADVADDKAAALATIHLEDFVVNLADGHSYLRIGIDMGVPSNALRSKTEQPGSNVPIIRDAVI